VESHRGTHQVERIDDVVMQTRDGTTLVADIYRPHGGGPWPVLVRRTPYGKRLNDLAAAFNEAHFFASHGYLVVVQDTRGRFASEGEWYPLIYEGLDGYDTLEWAAGLDGAAGPVGTFGQSYGCIIQYLTAAQRPPHLVTCVPVSGNCLSFQNYWYHHGVLELGWMLSYFVNMAEDVLRGQGRDEEVAALDDLKVDPAIRFSPLKEQVVRHLPINDWIQRLGDGAPFLEDVLYHSMDGPYWWANDLRRELHNIDVPMLHIGSWYDINTWDTPLLFNGLKDHAMSHYARSHQALFMGPWAHLLPYSQPTSEGSGDIDFGPEAEMFLPGMYLRWFDHFVKGDGQELPVPPVRLFVMGDNHWRDETEWPPARVVPTAWYLHSGGAASTLDGDGTLSTEPPGDEPPDHYTYDPAHPVPTRGGHYVGGGVADQRPNQTRPDVLVFTSAPLAHHMEITGPVTAELFVSTSAIDTDFVVWLSDVRPDGYCQNLCESIVRGRFHRSYTAPAPLEPGRVYRLEIDMWHLSHLVRASHRLRVHVTSSDFPRWERNLNNGSRLGYGAQFQVAAQTIYHNSEHPSQIMLPVLPRQDLRPTSSPG
jgi:uncharacterized protein